MTRGNKHSGQRTVQIDGGRTEGGLSRHLTLKRSIGHSLEFRIKKSLSVLFNIGAPSSASSNK